MKLADIFKDSNYKLSQFTADEIGQLEQTITLKASKSGEVPYTICLVRQKAIKLTPEEAIRQLYLQVLIDQHPAIPNSKISEPDGLNLKNDRDRSSNLIKQGIHPYQDDIKMFLYIQ